MSDKKSISYDRIFEYILAFLLPPLFMLAGFAAGKIFPFGSRSILSSDLQDQYIHIIAETANKIKSGENLYISYKAGFGTNFLIQAQPYLSLINLPFLFFETRDYQEVYTFVYLLRLALSGLTASIFFRHSSAAFLRGKLNIAFSVMYALTMFNITNRINLFFTNDVIFLPLCFLGVEQLVNKKRLVPFTAAYFICTLGGYYNMPFITGTACFIYFIYYAVISCKKPSDAVKPLGFLIISAFISAALSAFILLPSFNAVSAGYDKVFSFGGSLIAYGIPAVCRNLLFINDGAPVYAETPGMFIGIMPIFMTLWFVFSSNAHKKEKAAVLCIFIFYFLSFHIAPLYAAMHFFRLPMGYDGRYTYGMALLFLVFSARASRIDEKAKKRLPVPFILICTGIVLAVHSRINIYYLVFGFGAAACSLFYTLIQKSGKKRTLLAAAVITEAIISPCIGTYIITKYIVHPDHNGFKTYLDAAKNAAVTAKGDDSLFSREVDVYSPCKLFQLSAGYNSISTFLSTANQKTSKFAAALGVNSPLDGRMISAGSNCIITDSIFDIKYLFAADKRALSTDMTGRNVFAPDGMRLTNDIYRMTVGEQAACWENTTVFPLMFRADEKLKSCFEKFEDGFGSYFKNQEIFLNTAVASDNKYYDIIRLSDAEALNCELLPDRNGNFKIHLTSLPEYSDTAVANDQAGILHYTLTAEKDGDYCAEFYIQNPDASAAYQSYMAMVNGCYLNFDYLQDDTLHDLGYFKAGDVIDIQIITIKDGIIAADPLIARLDTDNFKAAAKKVSDGGLKNINENNGIITASCNFDTDSFVFSTISYDKGFELYIDGSRSDGNIVSVNDAFLGFDIPAGEHKIELHYKTPGFKTGLYISGITALILLLLRIIAVFFFKNSDRKNKIQ